MTKIYILALTFTLLLTGCASNNPLFGENITGRIIIKGQAPHTFVALKVRNRVYINVVGKLKRLLSASYQGKKITLRGHYVSKAVGVSQPARFEATQIVAIIER